MRKLRVFMIIPLLLVAQSRAGVYRHDRPESDYTSLAAKPEFDCVGQVKNKGVKSGSCVLIGHKYVLCAAHVFKVSETGRDTVYSNGSMIITYPPINERVGDTRNYTFIFKGTVYSAKSIRLYPTYMDPATKNNGDIAFIELESSVTDVVPAIVNEAFDELNSNVTGVGFGAWGVGDKMQTLDTTTKKIAGENVIDSIGGFLINNRPTQLYCDFDKPGDTSCNKMGSPVPRNLEYICAGGDSGGGLFLETKNGYRLCGICSGSGYNIQQFVKTAYYGQVMNWTRVSVFKDWIMNNER